MVKHIEDRVLRLSALVASWKRHGNIPRIERDLALDELREIYDALLNIDDARTMAASATEIASEPLAKTPMPKRGGSEHKNEPKSEPKSEPKPAVSPEVEHSADPIADFDDALDIDALLGITDSDSDSEPEPQPEMEPQPEPVPHAGGGLFAIEDIPVRTKSSRKMINLYTSSAAPASSERVVREPAAKAGSEPVAPQVASPIVASPIDTSAPQRLGDVLGSGVKVLGDVNTMDSAPIAPMNKIEDLRSAIGLNDKFLLLRDLFAGDVALYERTIDILNRFEDLDECMIYIVENFRWNPDSEGAKMLVSLIGRKLA